MTTWNIFARHIRWGERTAYHLARALFHIMARFRPKLECEQLLLGRFGDTGLSRWSGPAAI